MSLSSDRPPSDRPDSDGFELNAMQLAFIVFTFQAMILCKGDSGFMFGCLCGVWGRELSTCLLYLGQFFYTSVLNKLVYKVDEMEIDFVM